MASRGVKPLPRGKLSGIPFQTRFVDVAEKAGLRHRFNIASVPDTNVLSSTFGKALFQGSPGGTIGAQGATYGNQSGRQVELGFKILF
jgi:hypothetical protein